MYKITVRDRERSRQEKLSAVARPLKGSNCLLLYNARKGLERTRVQCRAKQSCMLMTSVMVYSTGGEDLADVVGGGVEGDTNIVTLCFYKCF